MAASTASRSFAEMKSRGCIAPISAPVYDRRRKGGVPAQDGVPGGDEEEGTREAVEDGFGKFLLAQERGLGLAAAAHFVVEAFGERALRGSRHTRRDIAAFAPRFEPRHRE